MPDAFGNGLMDLTTIKTRIRSLVDDPDATYATDAFLLPLIN
jgi:hypothetical protein